MISGATWARAAQAIEDGLESAFLQGWGREAAALLCPVRVALDSGPDQEVLAVITDQRALAGADPCSARGLYIARILDGVQADLAREGEQEPTDTVAAYTPRAGLRKGTVMISNLPVVHDVDGHVYAIVSWPHRRGGQGHCLVRLYPFDGRVVAVVSEISSNDDRLGIADDMAGVAGKALGLAQEHIDAEPRSITWVAHHGAFSYYDAFDPDTFTLVALVWDGRRYQDNLQDHRLLTEQEVHGLLDGRTLEPVPTVLTNLGWRQRGLRR